MLRAKARSLYTDLAMGACHRSTWKALDDVRGEEAAFVAALEPRVAGPATDHLAIAREDVDFAISSGGPGCWRNTEAGFPASHREMVLRDVETVRAELRDPIVPPEPLRGVDRFIEPQGAVFRALARAVLDSVRWHCPQHDMAPFLAPARPAVARFEARVTRTRFAAQFALAKADVDFRAFDETYNCVGPSGPMPAAELQAALRTLSLRIARAERIAGLASTQS